MAVARVQKKTATGTASPISCTFDAAPTAGNMLVAVLVTNTVSSNVEAVATWAGGDGEVAHDISTVGCVYAWWSDAQSGYSTFTVSTIAGNNQFRLHIFEYSGLSTQAPTTTEASNNTATTSQGIGQSVAGNGLVLLALGTGGTNGSNVAWNSDGNTPVLQTESDRLFVSDDLVNVANTTYTATWTTARTCAAIELKFHVPATVAPAVVNATTTLPAPTVSGTVNVTPTVVTAQTTVPAPTVAGTVDVTPTAVATSTTIPEPTVDVAGNAEVAPNHVAATATVPAPTVEGAVAVGATVVTVFTAVNTPDLSTGSTAEPTVLSLTTTVPTPGISTEGNANVAATVVTATTVNTPDLSTSSAAAPTVITVVATLPTVSLAVSQTAGRLTLTDALVNTLGISDVVATLTSSED